jgi:uncharacterized protein (TIRG00374 family)
MNRSKPKWKGLLKFLGPIFFTFIIIRVVDFEAAAGLFKEIKLGLALSTILLTPLIIVILTARWWFICQRLGAATNVTKLFQINYVSWFLSILPMVGVSPLAKYIYLKENGEPAGKTAISITLDKIFDVIGQIFFGFFGVMYFPEILFIDMRRWIFFALGGIIIGAVLVFWRKLWMVTGGVLKRYASKKVQKIGVNLENELSAFWSGFNLNFILKIIVISVILGFLRSTVLYLLAISLNITVNFIFIIACRALIGIVNAIPVSINGLGTRDAILLVALPLVGVSKEAAIALGFVAFLWTIGSKSSGVIFWLKHPLPTSEIFSIKDKPAS